jgi:dihydrofolate synthase/folylpolyglutamate synthase
VLECLTNYTPVNQQAVSEGLITVDLPGRLQVIPGAVTWILDVAHNLQAASYLAHDLARYPCSGRTHAVFACFADKDFAGMLQVLEPQVTRWHLTQSPGPRNCPWQTLATALETINATAIYEGYDSVNAAMDNALSQALTGDRILVTGSFLTVAAAIRYLS